MYLPFGSLLLSESTGESSRQCARVTLKCWKKLSMITIKPPWLRICNIYSQPAKSSGISGDFVMEQIVSSATTIDPVTMIKPRRKITGVSAILLPYTVGGEVDWDGLCAHVARTADAGLRPAVNMETGYVSLLDEVTRRKLLSLTPHSL